MIGFKFRNIHSSEFNIGVKSDDRSVVPERRKNEFIIPGRDGTIDFGLNTYEKRPITMTLGLMKNANWNELRLRARDIARWLSGKGMLIFDDEPDKAYQASVYTYVGLEQIKVMPMGILTVTFECQPFAESLEYRQVNIAEITQNNKGIPLVVNGTSESCCIITIKNTGDTDIKNILITRKAEI